MLGQGSYGKVYLARSTASPSGLKKEEEDTSAMVAIKILDKSKISQSEFGVRNLLQEIKVHWELEECDSILRLQEIYEDEVFVYLVLEYQQQGSLLGQILKNREFQEK